MKITTIELGYYHPSNANWSYHIHLVIDDTGARLYRETFGGDSRMREKMKAAGHDIQQINASKGTEVMYKWRDIKDLLDIESYTGKNW